ncbi:hypothetical protein DQ04_00431150 [Trypanosoma grayi]|uniref:hypothetical protein n=1 Tax=Trypanosoma grayi TaxID=71804 RepID=UPI0004F49080|nr:hypothetical protein DQ04_00431150 [Trypanosoma grayi]KEG14511.1 hypothetical protein DQ04_00431150 [Trypanosoma grayi]
MEDAVTLSVTLRRASPVTRRRVLVIAFGLCSRGKKNNTVLSLAAITTMLEFAMSGRPARFIFATGGNASVLRSHDRGGTWRVTYRANEAKWDPEKEIALSDGVDTMEDVAKFVPPARLEEIKSESRELPTNKLETQISHIATLNDIVAVCGSNGFLAVSADRGLTFVPLERDVLLDLLKESRTISTCDSWRVGGVAFVSERLLVFFYKKHLCSVELTSRGFGSVSFGKLSVIREFSTSIVSVHAFQRVATDVRELFVSTRGLLHYSCDAGGSFIMFPHELGVIRVVEPLDILCRRNEVPQVPKGLVDPLLATTTEHASGRKREKYVYRAVSRDFRSVENDGGEYTTEDTSDEAVMSALPHFSEGVHYRVFLVAGVGAPILPYDYTAILFIAASLGSSTDQSRIVGSLAEKVEYVPYIRSGVDEPISIAVCRRPGPGGCVFARSNASGISLSTDMGVSWTVPTQAYTVAVVAVDGGEFVCCNRRSFVITITEKGSDVHSVSTDLRVPFLTDAAVML